MVRRFTYEGMAAVSNAEPSEDAPFIVEKDVPLPDKYTRHHYPFDEMEVGHSFLAPATCYPAIVSAASWYGKRHNKKFSIRKTENGYRCWRVK